MQYTLFQEQSKYRAHQKLRTEISPTNNRCELHLSICRYTIEGIHVQSIDETLNSGLIYRYFEYRHCMSFNHGLDLKARLS